MMKSLFAALAFTGILLAQGPGMGQGPVPAAGAPAAAAALKEFLGLTDAQVQQLIDLRRTLPDVMRPFNEQLRTAQQALRAEMDKTNPDPAVVGRLMVESKRIRERMEAAREKLDDQAKALLTPEQRTKLAQLVAAQRLAPAIRQGERLGLLDGSSDARPGGGAGPAMFPDAPGGGMGGGMGAGFGNGMMGGRGPMGGRGMRGFSGPVI